MDNSLTFTTPTPLPKWQIAICVLIQVCESFNINVLFPFLPFLTEDLCGDRNLGTNAGIIAASFCTAQFVSTYPWGQLSDKYGRKPTLFFGTIGTGIGTGRCKIWIIPIHAGRSPTGTCACAHKTRSRPRIAHSFIHACNVLLALNDDAGQ